MHNFNDSLKRGKHAEFVLDETFKQWYSIDTVPIEFEKFAKIDRIFRSKSGSRTSVEYKADSTAAYTGNVFLETVSVLENNTPGWLFESLAYILIYYIPPIGVAYMARMQVVRQIFIPKISHYDEKDIPNDRYTTRGICVPISEFEQFCDRKITIPQTDKDKGTATP